MIINGIKMPNFKSKEFPEDPATYADWRLLHSLQSFRYRLGAPFSISPAAGALARFKGSLTSEHRIIKHYDSTIRLSTAIDGFPSGDIFRAWIIAQNCGSWNGVGVYFDTERNGESAPMLHLDLREKPLIWYRAEKKYYYPSNKNFYRNLMEQFIIHKKLEERATGHWI